MKNDHGTEVFLEKNFQFQNCSNQFTALTYVLVHLHSELPLTSIQEIPQSLAVHIHPLRTKQCQLGSAKFKNIFHSSEKLNKSSSDRIWPWLSEFGTLQRQAKQKGDDTVSLSQPLRWAKYCQSTVPILENKATIPQFYSYQAVKPSLLVEGRSDLPFLGFEIENMTRRCRPCSVFPCDPLIFLTGANDKDLPPVRCNGEVFRPTTSIIQCVP